MASAMMGDAPGGSGEQVVYAFQVYDVRLGDEVVAPYKAPLEQIERLGGQPLLGTAEAVSAEELDLQGRYRRVATGWGVLV